MQIVNGDNFLHGGGGSGVCVCGGEGGGCREFKGLKIQILLEQVQYIEFIHSPILNMGFINRGR